MLNTVMHKQSASVDKAGNMSQPLRPASASSPPPQHVPAKRGSSVWIIVTIVLIIGSALCCMCLATIIFLRGAMVPGRFDTSYMDSLEELDDLNENNDDADDLDDSAFSYNPELVAQAEKYFTFSYVGTPPSEEYDKMVRSALVSHYDDILFDFGLSTLPMVAIRYFTDYTQFSGVSPSTVEDYWVGGMAYYPDEIEILLDSRSITEIPFSILQYLAWHELTHIATYNRFTLASYYLPDWTMEGVAEHITNKYWQLEYGESYFFPYDPNNLFASLEKLETSISSADLTIRGQAYDMAHGFIDHIIDTYGWGKLLSAMARTESNATKHDFSRAFKAVTGDDLETVYQNYYQLHI